MGSSSPGASGGEQERGQAAQELGRGRAFSSVLLSQVQGQGRENGSGDYGSSGADPDDHKDNRGDDWMEKVRRPVSLTGYLTGASLRRETPSTAQSCGRDLAQICRNKTKQRSPREG